MKTVEIKNFLKKLPRTLGKNVFIFFLVIVFLELILGGFLFYKYSILAEKTKIEIIEETIQFEEEIFQGVLDEWIEQRKSFNETEIKKYPNPFQAR